MDLKPYQQRVVDEHQELESKLTKLGDFIKSSPNFTSLPSSEQDLLILQRAGSADPPATLHDGVSPHPHPAHRRILVMNDIAPFAEFPKMARLSRECLITEKLDGTNAQIYITDDGQLLTGSRARWVTPQDDNYGFARWALEHRDELMTLGAGRHFGEWWGQGIQRKYGMSEKRWSLFNVSRWCLAGEAPQRIPTADPRVEKYQNVLPACCSLVPVLYRGIFTTDACEAALADLRATGSKAAPWFMQPEGIVCFHIAANCGFKKTLQKDEVPKALQHHPLP